MSTAMSAAFERVGISKAEMEAYAAATKFIKSGGVREGWIMAYERAAEKLGAGHGKTALEGHSHNAGAQPLIPSEGQENPALTGQAPSADARAPIANGGGHIVRAPQGPAVPVSPVRVPGPTYIRALADSRKRSARTLLDLRKTSDGRAWGDVSAYELTGMERDGAIAKAVAGILGPLNSIETRKSLRELLTPAQFESALAQVELRNDNR